MYYEETFFSGRTKCLFYFHAKLVLKPLWRHTPHNTRPGNDPSHQSTKGSYLFHMKNLKTLLSDDHFKLKNLIFAKKKENYKFLTTTTGSHIFQNLFHSNLLFIQNTVR